ncbi:CBS domain-containing protein [Faecalispora anaeroviscerum]|uniref:CBS domain-containing protein n=1 Tax=Faecalispora anaeroviscerum TaxID=2991836 RepID=UPI0024BAF79D|nr:CBS domain-containing protein [Faecalispora anaeroviscerum]
MKVRNIMSTGVTKLNPGDSIEKAAQLMKQHDIGSIPVCDQEKVIGIVTDRDIATRSAAEGQDAKQQRVCDIMSTNPVVGSPEMDAHEVAKLMSEKQIRRLPIVENNSLVGVVALGDISVQPTLQDNAGEALKNISQSDSGSQM